MKFLRYLPLAALRLFRRQRPRRRTKVTLPQVVPNNDVVALRAWAYDSLYASKHIRAEYLIDRQVFGPKGGEIGNVADVMISDGQIRGHRSIRLKTGCGFQ